MTSTITEFIVLIEWRRLKETGLRTFGMLMLIASFAWAHAAHAQALPSKISADLPAAMRSTTSAPPVNWAKDFNSTRIVLSESGQAGVSSVNDSSLLGEA